MGKLTDDFAEDVESLVKAFDLSVEEDTYDPQASVRDQHNIPSATLRPKLFQNRSCAFYAYVEAADRAQRVPASVSAIAADNL